MLKVFPTAGSYLESVNIVIHLFALPFHYCDMLAMRIEDRYVWYCCSCSTHPIIVDTQKALIRNYMFRAEALNLLSSEGCIYLPVQAFGCSHRLRYHRDAMANTQYKYAVRMHHKKLER